MTSLNGSAVTSGEREDAERFFIRYHFDHSEEELPHRYGFDMNTFCTTVPVAHLIEHCVHKFDSQKTHIVLFLMHKCTFCC